MKYVLLVHGPMAENEAERAAGMAEMADWYGTLGRRLWIPAVHSPGASRPSARRG
jgi:hypothetical protein